MSLWFESLSLCLYDSRDDLESRAKCIFSHLSMTVPRSWWERALQTNSIPSSYAHILHDLRKELLNVPELVGKIQFDLLVALPFAVDDAGKKEPNFGTIDNQYSMEEYLDKARKILIARPELANWDDRLITLENAPPNQLNSSDAKNRSH